tara:strand:+ start:3367 stop:3714 length:348 start_codon:yes stop_codon:yes gene_type:complete
MRIPKRYGQSKKTECPFCGKLPIAKNEQGLDVCIKHKGSFLDEMKCFCGAWLELRDGKYGPYFNCLKCGNLNYRRVMEMGNVKERGKVVVEKEIKPKRHEGVEIEITTDDVEYFS